MVGASRTGKEVRYNRAVKSKRSNVEQGSLFDMDRREHAVSVPNKLEIDRPFVRKEVTKELIR